MTTTLTAFGSNETEWKNALKDLTPYDKEFILAYRKRKAQLTRYLDPDTVRDPTKVLCEDCDGYLRDATKLFTGTNQGLRSFTNRSNGTGVTVVIGMEKKSTMAKDAMARLNAIASVYRELAEEVVTCAGVDKELAKILDNMNGAMAAFDKAMSSFDKGLSKTAYDQKESGKKTVKATVNVIDELKKDDVVIRATPTDHVVEIPVPNSCLYSFDFVKGYCLSEAVRNGWKVRSIRMEGKA